MKLLLVALLAPLALIRAVLMTEPVQETPVGPIGFQIHSYNDLREFRSVLRKGARFVKIDPHYISRWKCAEQDRVKNKMDERGCFVLNHDVPEFFSMRRTFNTTDDLLDLIASPEIRPFLSYARERLYIALCWKSIPGIPDQCESPQSDEVKHWISLVDDFFRKATTVVRENNLNVEFVMDSGVPLVCHKDRWRPWVSTSSWTIDALFSNNETLGYDRYQVLNPSVGSAETRGLESGAPCGDFLDCAKTKWGKFGSSDTSSKHAIQVYEPSNQIDIQRAANIFIDTGVKHPTGLRFAINVDPAAFQVFSSGFGNGPGLNDVVRTNASAPMIARLSDEGRSIVVLRADTASSSLEYAIREANGTISSFAPLPRGGDEILRGNVNAVSACVGEDGEIVLVSSENGRSALYALKSNQLVYVSNFSAPTTTLSTRLVRRSGSGIDSAPLVATLGSTANCTVALDFYSLPPTLATKSATQCLVADDDVPTGIAFDVLDVDSRITVFAAYEIDRTIYGVGATVRRGRFDDAVSAAAVLGVGTAPAVSLSLLGTKNDIDDVAVVIVQSDAFCWNNEAQNKDAKIGLCDQEPRSTKNVLSYSYGRFADVVDFLLDERSTWLGPCESRNIAHGWFDQGSRPSVVLFPVSDSGGEMRVLEVHESLGDDEVDHGQCGMPSSGREESVILDSWDLIDLSAR